MHTRMHTCARTHRQSLIGWYRCGNLAAAAAAPAAPSAHDRGACDDFSATFCHELVETLIECLENLRTYHYGAAEGCGPSSSSVAPTAPEFRAEGSFPGGRGWEGNVGRVQDGETIGVGGSTEWRRNKLRTELLIKCVIAVRNAAQDPSMAVRQWEGIRIAGRGRAGHNSSEASGRAARKYSEPRCQKV